MKYNVDETKELTIKVTSVYIKFGPYHGTKGKIVGESVKAGFPSYIIQTHDGNIIEKKQRNVVRVNPK